MKNEQIQEFFTKVAQDEGFKAEILKFKEELEAKKLNEQDVQKFVGKVLLPKAKKLGYDFSEKDLADFGNSQGMANLDKLSLEDMENVSGGVNKGFLGAMFSLAMFMGVGAGVTSVVPRLSAEHVAYAEDSETETESDSGTESEAEPGPDRGIVTPARGETEAGRGTATATDSAVAALALSETESEAEAWVLPNKRPKLGDGTAKAAGKKTAPSKKNVDAALAANGVNSEVADAGDDAAKGDSGIAKRPDKRQKLANGNAKKARGNRTPGGRGPDASTVTRRQTTRPVVALHCGLRSLQCDLRSVKRVGSTERMPARVDWACSGLARPANGYCLILPPGLDNHVLVLEKGSNLSLLMFNAALNNFEVVELAADSSDIYLVVSEYSLWVSKYEPRECPANVTNVRDLDHFGFTEVCGTLVRHSKHYTKGLLYKADEKGELLPGTDPYTKWNTEAGTRKVNKVTFGEEGAQLTPSEETFELKAETVPDTVDILLIRGENKVLKDVPIIKWRNDHDHRYKTIINAHKMCDGQTYMLPKKMNGQVLLIPGGKTLKVLVYNETEGDLMTANIGDSEDIYVVVKNNNLWVTKTQPTTLDYREEDPDAGFSMVTDRSVRSTPGGVVDEGYTHLTFKPKPAAASKRDEYGISEEKAADWNDLKKKRKECRLSFDDDVACLVDSAGNVIRGLVPSTRDAAAGSGERMADADEYTLDALARAADDERMADADENALDTLARAADDAAEALEAEAVSMLRMLSAQTNREDVDIERATKSATADADELVTLPFAADDAREAEIMSAPANKRAKVIVTSSGTEYELAASTSKVSYRGVILQSVEGNKNEVLCSLPKAAQVSILDGAAVIQKVDINCIQVSYKNDRKPSVPHHVPMQMCLVDGTHFTVTGRAITTLVNLLVAVKDNPRKDLATHILTKKDVRASLSNLFTAAGINTADTMRNFWSSAVLENPELFTRGNAQQEPQPGLGASAVQRMRPGRVQIGVRPTTNVTDSVAVHQVLDSTHGFKYGEVTFQRDRRNKNQLLCSIGPGSQVSMNGALTIRMLGEQEGASGIHVQCTEDTGPNTPGHVFILMCLDDGTKFPVTRRWISTLGYLLMAMRGHFNSDDVKAMLQSEGVRPALCKLFADAGYDTADKMVAYLNSAKGAAQLPDSVVTQSRTPIQQKQAMPREQQLNQNLEQLIQQISKTDAALAKREKVDEAFLGLLSERGSLHRALGTLLDKYKEFLKYRAGWKDFDISMRFGTHEGWQELMTERANLSRLLIEPLNKHLIYLKQRISAVEGKIKSHRLVHYYYYLRAIYNSELVNCKFAKFDQRNNDLNATLTRMDLQNLQNDVQRQQLDNERKKCEFYIECGHLDKQLVDIDLKKWKSKLTGSPDETEFFNKQKIPLLVQKKEILEKTLGKINDFSFQPDELDEIRKRYEATEVQIKYLLSQPPRQPKTVSARGSMMSRDTSYTPAGSQVAAVPSAATAMHSQGPSRVDARGDLPRTGVNLGKALPMNGKLPPLSEHGQGLQLVSSQPQSQPQQSAMVQPRLQMGVGTSDGIDAVEQFKGVGLESDELRNLGISAHEVELQEAILESYESQQAQSRLQQPNMAQQRRLVEADVRGTITEVEQLLKKLDEVELELNQLGDSKMPREAPQFQDLLKERTSLLQNGIELTFGHLQLLNQRLGAIDSKLEQHAQRKTPEYDPQVQNLLKEHEDLKGSIRDLLDVHQHLVERRLSEIGGELKRISYDLRQGGDRQKLEEQRKRLEKEDADIRRNTHQLLKSLR